jgi:hypothetical protein
VGILSQFLEILPHRLLYLGADLDGSHERILS